MRIQIITPAPKGSRKGNRITAIRWARMLRSLGHRVSIETEFVQGNCDLMLALHARKSHESIRQFRQKFPDRPLIVALTGTDLYQEIHRNEAAKRSLDLADRLIILQPKGAEELPDHVRNKARTIYQSAVKPRGEIRKRKTTFDVCVVGHLRPVKDPFRAALAVRKLPSNSKIRILHVGAALDDVMAAKAQAEMKLNPRYHWLGEKLQWQTRRKIAGCRLLVLSSKMEGGANVISEGVVASVPILASEIPGTIGLLGEEYPGYFRVGDTAELRRLLVRAEADPEHLEELRQWGRGLRQKFDPVTERESLRELLMEISP